MGISTFIQFERYTASVEGKKEEEIDGTVEIYYHFCEALRSCRKSVVRDCRKRVLMSFSGRVDRLF